MHPKWFLSCVLGRENKNIHHVGVPHSSKRDKHEKAKEKAVYVTKNKRKMQIKGTSRRATLHKWFLDNEIHATTVYFRIDHPVPLTSTSPSSVKRLSPKLFRALVILWCYNDGCKHTTPSSTQINMVLRWLALHRK